MQGTVGWICPMCGAVSSPYYQTCAKCAPKPTIGLGTLYVGGGYGTYSGWSGTITFGGTKPAPAKTDAQKLEEALARAVKAERKAEKYSAWADKLIEFYEQLNDLTQELDELTNEPDEIEGNE